MIKSSVKIGDQDKIPSEIPLKITIEERAEICVKKGVQVKIEISEKLYYIYRINPDGTESKYFRGKNKNTIYNYKDMVEFTTLLDAKTNHQYRVEEIK